MAREFDQMDAYAHRAQPLDIIAVRTDADDLVPRIDKRTDQRIAEDIKSAVAVTDE